MLTQQCIADRYDIIAEAGAGGVATVYQAKDRVTGQAVAIKVLRGTDPRADQRFLREAQLLADLYHPGIVGYLGHGRTLAGDPFLVMEWLDGQDLADWLEQNSMSIAQAVDLVIRVAEALAVAHHRGVIHRDIKPGNLFLVGSSIDAVRVIDFGLARFADARATNTGVILGTPQYMAPEQARGASELDVRADVYSLGCVLFECLTGSAPFNGEHIMAILAKVLLEEAPRASQRRPDIPPSLDDLVAKMLAKDPAQRPRDTEELLNELHRILCRPEPKKRRSHRLPARTLTGEEKRLLSVILAQGVRQTQVANTTTLIYGQVDDWVSRLREAIGHLDTHLEPLADGSLVVTVTGAGSATDQVVQAARCAMAMRGAAPGARIALVTGRGMINEGLPVGELIDRATRLLGLGQDPGQDPRASSLPAGSIRVDELTVGLLESRFQVIADAQGLVLVGERETAESPRTLLGRQTPCLGREKELGMLVGMLDECVADDTPCAVLVTAPAGTGKSRLRQELTVRIRQKNRNVDVWLGRGDPVRAGSPFALLAAAIRQAFGLVTGEPTSACEKKLRSRLGRRLAGKDLDRVVEFIGILLGVRFSEKESLQLQAARRDAMLMSDQLVRAWLDCLNVELADKPILLLLEDLHWGDVPSIKLVDTALRCIVDKPLMVLALARPEVQERFPGLWAERNVQTVQLRELSRKACEKLVLEVLGENAARETVARVVDRAGGNVFFLEELIRMVVQHQGDALPETVLAIVQARLERLPPEARRILRAASIFGTHFSPGGVGALLGQTIAADAIGDWL
ncbi:MAG: protein kinase, partial [Pseudomonadota bacterium]